ncbi:sensor histidine kinase [Hyphomonas johnsonii]|uniref:histidine kinase n=1 Tax=Hyphomonas johnsonii MHS-2 TaxID=1280950 RepID=A0A059FQI4_9PROT|nr:ATP-binding protein [Hyphomonas johnsonii]KCZ92718.1 sensor histidine kinase [Hyphomonas johnsonii MHS-2]
MNRVDPSDVRLPGRSALTRRARDFVVVGLCFSAVLFLLAVTGELGWIEAITAFAVSVSVVVAYYVGSAAFLPVSSPSGPQSTSPEGPQDQAIAQVLQALPLPALEVDLEGRITGFNPPADMILHLEGRYKPHASAVIRSPALLSAIERTAKGEEAGIMSVEVNSGPDETWRANVSLLQGTGHTLVMLEDLTPVRRAARARSDFLANASHELRTPLTALSGFIETMRGPAKDDKASWDRFLDIMAGESERMSRLIADLLSLSRIEFSEHIAPSEREDFTRIVRDAAEALQPIADDRSITLDIRGDAAALPVIAHRDEVVQVVENLLTNALKYSSAGGRVTVSYGDAASMADARGMAGQAWPESDRMTLLPAGGRPGVPDPSVWLRIEDQGPGIEREHLPRLGERFYRADQSRGGKITGTGLGLAIVKHIMAHHRGGLSVETRMGEGSAFGIWMPAAPGRTAGTKAV